MNLNSSGLSIVEFMIATTLGALLVAAAGSVYLSNKTTYTIQEGLARLQENARYATYILNHDIRMAGFQGCASESFVAMNNLVKNPTSVLLYDMPLKGFDGGGSNFSPTLPSNLSGLADANSDVLEIRMASNTNVQLKADMNLTNNPILVHDRLGIQAGEIIMISNCSIGDIFVAGGNTNATSITHTVTNNTSNDLSFPYATGSQVMRYVYYAFYIKNTGRNNSANQPIYALVRQDIQGNEVEIVEGVEQMKITYGVDINDDKTADTYRTAAQITSSNQWNQVISLKINLLFSTIENLVSKTKPYQFNGGSYTPSDRKLRQQWETFINIRNRGLPS